VTDLERAEVVILGAGIAGCALAHHLVQRTVGPVVVYDPATPGAGATGRAAGIVTEQLWNEWDVEVTRASKAEYAALAARWDPTAYSVNGFARWTRDAAAAEAIAASIIRLRAWGVAVEPIDGDGLARRIPAARFHDVRAGMWSAEDAVVTPSAMNEIYAESARHGGADLELGVPWKAFHRVDGAWELETRTRRIRAVRAVIAAGAWSKRLAIAAGHPLPLVPYRTQAAVLRPSPPEPPTLPSVHDIDLDVYVRPESNGRILAGDGTEHVEADPETFRPGGDETFVGHLAESFESRFPGWADAEMVRAWAGVCAATPDRRPLVGPVPGAEGLHALAGFNGFGVMRAGGVAERLARVLSAGEGDGRAEELLGPVLPGRFHDGPMAFRPRPGFTLEAGDDPRF
jgi:sarcosine oxidase, subunit beta